MRQGYAAHSQYATLHPHSQTLDLRVAAHSGSARIAAYFLPNLQQDSVRRLLHLVRKGSCCLLVSPEDSTHFSAAGNPPSPDSKIGFVSALDPAVVAAADTEGLALTADSYRGRGYSVCQLFRSAVPSLGDNFVAAHSPG